MHPSITSHTDISPLSPAYANSDDRDMHLQLISELSAEVGLPLEEVRKFYEITLGSMRVRAKIYDYLPILVPKRVKRLLTH